MRQASLPLCCLAFLIAATPIPAPATVMDALSLEALCRRSDALVVGRVQSSWASLRRGRIDSWHALDVARVIAGRAPTERILVRQLGGAVGPHALHVAGAPALAPGAEVLAFLRSEREGVFHVVGLAQGLFRVRSNGARQTAERELSGLTLRGGGVESRIDVGVLVRRILRACAGR